MGRRSIHLPLLTAFLLGLTACGDDDDVAGPGERGL